MRLAILVLFLLSLLMATIGAQAGHQGPCPTVDDAGSGGDASPTDPVEVYLGEEYEGCVAEGDWTDSYTMDVPPESALYLDVDGGRSGCTFYDTLEVTVTSPGPIPESNSAQFGGCQVEKTVAIGSKQGGGYRLDFHVPDPFWEANITYNFSGESQKVGNWVVENVTDTPRPVETSLVDAPDAVSLQRTVEVEVSNPTSYPLTRSATVTVTARTQNCLEGCRTERLLEYTVPAFEAGEVQTITAEWDTRCWVGDVVLTATLDPGGPQWTTQDDVAKHETSVWVGNAGGMNACALAPDAGV